MAPLPACAISKANEALALARSGDVFNARTAVSEALALEPNDVNVRHISGLVCSICGDLDKALSHFHRALEILPNFHFTEVEIALLYQARGDQDEARRWFDKAISSAPHHIPAFIMAAQLERRRGASFVALELLERAHQIAPTDPTVIRELVDVLVWHSEREKAAKLLEEAIANGDLGSDAKIKFLGLLSELGEYVKLLHFCEKMDVTTDPALARFVNMQSGHARLALAYNRTDKIRSAQHRECSARWQSVITIRASLQTVISARCPFSLIRLGDGEGRILVYLDSASRNLMSDQEADAIGNSIWNNWFGSSLQGTRIADLQRLSAAIDDALLHADMIGLSTARRLMIDNFHFGYLAYLDSYVDRFITSRDVIVTDATINTELHKLTPFYRELLEGLDFIGVVGPHAGLASRLAAHLNISRHITYLVPGEMRLPAQLDIVRGIGHFPQRFDELMTQISVPKPGAVFLVAAGLLGKIYCAQIKRLGGIAIDIGAVADAWTGINSRPGLYDRPEEWAL